MPRQAKKLTKRDLDKLRSAAEADPAFSRTLADAGQPGLYAQARRGRVRFFLRYVGANGQRRTMDIDFYGAITLDRARRIAQEHRAVVASGIDPLEMRDEKRRQSATVADAVAGYLDDLRRRAESGTAARGKPGGYEAAKRLLERYVLGSPLARKRLRDVKVTDVQRLHANVAAPTEANRMATALSAVCGWAIKAGLLPLGANPVKAVERHREDGRRRALTADELRALGAALHEAESAGGVLLDGRRQAVHASVVLAVRLLALTGSRRAEVVGQAGKDRRGKLEGLRWGDVDLDRGLVHLRDTKSGKQTRVIGAAAVELLRAAKPARAGVTDPVCPGGIPGEAYSYGFDKMRRRLWDAAGITGTAEGRADAHSLRHSFASIGAHLAGGRYAPFVSALLGHGVQVQQAITKRYITEDPESQRPAADAIAAEIASLLGLGEPAAVLAFPGGRR